MAINLSDRKPNKRKRIRSHALNTTKMRQKVNMQKVTLNGVTVIMSAKEAKKFRKNNAE